MSNDPNAKVDFRNDQTREQMQKLAAEVVGDQGLAQAGRVGNALCGDCRPSAEQGPVMPPTGGPPKHSEQLQHQIDTLEAAFGRAANSKSE